RRPASRGRAGGAAPGQQVISGVSSLAPRRAFARTAGPRSVSISSGPPCACLCQPPRATLNGAGRGKAGRSSVNPSPAGLTTGASSAPTGRGASHFFGGRTTRVTGQDGVVTRVFGFAPAFRSLANGTWACPAIATVYSPGRAPPCTSNVTVASP